MLLTIEVFREVNFVRRSLQLCMLAAVLLGPAASAEANVPLGGQKWPSGKIKVYDATPKSMRWSINWAIKHLNQVGARVTITKVSKRSRADVVISRKKKLPTCSGMATLGRAPGHDFVWVRDCRGYPFAEYMLVGIVVHELGHNLGLQHARGDKCAVMTAVLTQECMIDEDKREWRCAPVTSADLKALVRRYGKRRSRVERTWCPLPQLKFPSSAKPPKNLALKDAAWEGDPWFPNFRMNFSFSAFSPKVENAVSDVYLRGVNSSCASVDWGAAVEFRYDVEPESGAVDLDFGDVAAGTWCFRIESDLTSMIPGAEYPAPAVSNAVEVTIPQSPSPPPEE